MALELTLWTISNSKENKSKNKQMELNQADNFYTEKEITKTKGNLLNGRR